VKAREFRAGWDLPVRPTPLNRETAVGGDGWLRVCCGSDGLACLGVGHVGRRVLRSGIGVAAAICLGFAAVPVCGAEALSERWPRPISPIRNSNANGHARATDENVPQALAGSAEIGRQA